MLFIQMKLFEMTGFAGMLAKGTFAHILHLDLNFHLSKQVGSLTRAIDRGTRYSTRGLLQ